MISQVNMEQRNEQSETGYGSMAVLLVSCDKYRDLWPLCTTLIRRFWPSCPYPMYLVSNESAAYEGFSNIAIGPDLGWSANLIAALDRLSEPYVLLFLEDLLLEQPVDTKRVATLFEWFQRVQGNCLRMNPKPPPDLPCNEMVGIARPGGLYRASTVMTLWRRSVLRDLLDPTETAWQFEIQGSVRSDRFEGFYAARATTFSVINAIGRGSWSRRAIQRVRGLGIEPDLCSRATLSVVGEWKVRLLEIRSKILSYTPTQYRRRIRQMLMG